MANSAVWTTIFLFCVCISASVKILFTGDYLEQPYEKQNLWGIGSAVLALQAAEAAINHTMSLEAHFAHVGSQPLEVAETMLNLLNKEKPCIVVGNEGSDKSNILLSYITSGRGIPQAVVRDQAMTILYDPVSSPTSWIAIGQYSGPAGMVPPFLTYVAASWTRAALLLSTEVVHLKPTFQKMAKDQGLYLDVHFAVTGSNESLKSTMQALKSQRHSIIGAFLPRLPVDVRMTFYNSAVEQGLVGDGFLWFFMQKSNAENPEDLIVEGTELGEQWLGTRGLVAPAQEPAEVDPAKWGPGGIYPMSWLITYQTLLGEAMALMSEGAPLYNGTSLSFDVDCATGVGPGAQGLRCGAWPGPSAAEMSSFTVNFMNTYILARQASFLALLLEQNGLCKENKTAEEILKMKQLLLEAEYQDDLNGASKYRCQGGETSLRVEDCTSQIFRNYGTQVVLLGQLYPAGVPEFGLVSSLGWYRGFGWIARDGKVYDIDPKLGLSNMVVAEKADGGQIRYMQNSTQKPKSYAPDSCGQSFIIDETSPTAECLPCPRGTGNPMNGSNTCSIPLPEVCPAGRCWNFEAVVCEKCPVGTIAAVPGLTDCEQCPEGLFASVEGSMQCTPCPMGSIAPLPGQSSCMPCEMGSYTNASDRIHCTPCPASFVTIQRGSVSMAECVCPKGFLRLQGQFCAQCNEEAAFCPGEMNDTRIESKENYFLSVYDFHVVSDEEGVGKGSSESQFESLPHSYLCISDKNCPEGSRVDECPVGYTGPVCAECEAGWYRSSSDCVECDVGPFSFCYAILGPVIIFGVLSILLLKISSKPKRAAVESAETMASIVAIFLNFSQIIGVLPSMNVEWPPFLKSAFDFCSLVFSLNLGAVGYECYAGKIDASILEKPFVLLLSTLFMSMMWKLSRSTSKLKCLGLYMLPFAGLTNAIGTLLDLCFEPLAMAGFNMFNCYAHPSGGSSIRSKPQMICFGPAWVTRVLPSTAVLILLTLAIYTLFVILACYAARMKKEHTHSITFIWGRFRPEAYYWGIPFITRNLFIAIAPALSQNPFIVATLINSSLLIYLYYLLRFWPWKTPLQNVADAVVVLSLNITVATGAFFARNHTFPYSEDQETFAWFFLRIAATFPIVGAFVACAVVLALGCLESKRKPRQKLVNKVLAMYADVTIDLAAIVKTTEGDEEMEKKLRANFNNLSHYDAETIWNAFKILNTYVIGSQVSKTMSRRIDLDGAIARGSRLVFEPVNDMLEPQMSRDEKQSPKETAEHEEKKDPEETPVRVSINENAQDGVKNIWI